VCWKPCSSCWSFHLLREEFLSAPIHSPLSGSPYRSFSPAHPHAPPVAAKPSAGCAGRRHTHPLLQQIRRGCGERFRVDPTAAAIPGQLRQEEPSSGADPTTPRVDPAAPDTDPAARDGGLRPSGGGEGGGSAGLSVAALCPLPPRGVPGSLLASPVDAPLPVMGGSLILSFEI
jgi:hypothetical protein